MILESYEWKQTIKRNNAYIRRCGSAAILDEEGYLLDRIQIRIVTTALIARRLLETPKVATNLKDVVIPVIAHPWTGSRVDYLNCHRIDAKYQINNPVSKTVQGTFLCDQIIHSFVWTWVSNEDENQLDSFIVCSDRKKHSEVHVVDIQEWLTYSQSLANSNPSTMHSTRNRDTGEWEFTSF
jgi:hypothetical protein